MNDLSSARYSFYLFCRLLPNDTVLHKYSQVDIVLHECSQVDIVLASVSQETLLEFIYLLGEMVIGYE